MTTVNTTLIDGGELPIVFLHGLFGQGKNWQTIARSLRDEATSLLVDVPNHGRSDWTTRFDYDELADLVYESALAQPGFSGGFVLVGHSMGGKIAMRIALRHPEAVTAVVVVDISPVAGTLGQAFPGLVAAFALAPTGWIERPSHRRRTPRHRYPERADQGFPLAEPGATARRPGVGLANEPGVAWRFTRSSRWVASHHRAIWRASVVAGRRQFRIRTARTHRRHATPVPCRHHRARQGRWSLGARRSARHCRDGLAFIPGERPTRCSSR